MKQKVVEANTENIKIKLSVAFFGGIYQWLVDSLNVWLVIQKWYSCQDFLTVCDQWTVMSNVILLFCKNDNAYRFFNKYADNNVWSFGKNKVNKVMNEIFSMIMISF